MAGGGRRVVPGQLLRQAKIVEGPGLARPGAEVVEHLQGLLMAGCSRRVFSGRLLQFAEVPEGVGQAVPMAEAPVQFRARARLAAAAA